MQEQKWINVPKKERNIQSLTDDIAQMLFSVFPKENEKVLILCREFLPRYQIKYDKESQKNTFNRKNLIIITVKSAVEKCVLNQVIPLIHIV